MVSLENRNSNMFRQLDCLIAEKILENKRIILFGLNTTSFCIKNYLESRGYRISAYLDNDSRKREEAEDMFRYVLPNHLSMREYQNTAEEFIRVYSPEEYLGKRDENDEIVVLIASKYYPQMCRQLKDMGYEEGRHIRQVVSFYSLDDMLVLEDGENWRELDSGELRQRQLALLDELKNVCEENGLRYYLCGGTLLGAVRHKGYIPWDDDIDVAMPMPDYLRLIELTAGRKDIFPVSLYGYPDSYYNFFMRFTDGSTMLKQWEYPFLMTSGVSIDVFPLFGLPEERKDIDVFYSLLRKYNTRYRNSFIQNPEDTEEVLGERRLLKNKILGMMEKHPFDKSRYIGYLLSKYGEKEIMPSSIYKGKEKLLFEGRLYTVASGYKDYLIRIFGNGYMELPPEEERTNTHNYRAFVRR